MFTLNTQSYGEEINEQECAPRDWIIEVNIHTMYYMKILNFLGLFYTCCWGGVVKIHPHPA